MKPQAPNPLQELLAKVKEAERKKRLGRRDNPRADPQSRWVRFNHFVWDKRRGEG